MHTVTSFRASAVSCDELSDSLADCLALDRVRIFRRLLVTRFALLALLAALVGTFVHGLSLIRSIGSTRAISRATDVGMDR
jgi:hypothetical protein